MTIRVECPTCHAVLNVPTAHAGKKGKCSGCKGVIQVPADPYAVKERPQPPPLPPSAFSTPAIRIEPLAPVSRATPLVPPPTPVQPKPSISSAARAPNVGPQPTHYPGADATRLVSRPPATENGPGTTDKSRIALERELLAAFRGDIAGVEVPVRYRLGIVLSAVVMILLPLAYFAIVGLTAWGVWLHATRNRALLDLGSNHGSLMTVLLYAAPIVSGTILVLFMLKPMFARPWMMGRSRSLTRQGEPLLFAFVDRVCQAVGSRPPSRIKVDWQLNASAGWEEGWLGLFRDRLVLTIGAPLVAGLDAGEFAGVLAHEFGHFTQGAGRRMSFFVRWTSLWFLRVVYQRDEWDAWLDELANRINLRISWVLHLARLGVWLSRRILWLLMIMGNAVSSFLLRQMEFHADAHEAQLAGGAVFESTTRKMTALEVAYKLVFADLRQLVRRGRLPDDLSQLMLDKRTHFTAELLQQIDQEISQRKTRLFDTHPAPRDRIARAHLESAPAVFADHRPAAILFSDFKALSRNTTGDLYRATFGSRFQPSKMQSVEEATRSEEPFRDPLAPITLD